MDIYYFVIAITFLLCYQIKVPETDSKAYLKKVIWVFVPIAIYGALRVNFGNDYGRYEELFYHYHSGLRNIDESDHAEIGYQYLNYYIPSWRMLLILVSTSVVAGFVLLYSKYVEPRMLMLAMFFTMLYPNQTFFLQFVSMRNGLAIAGAYLCLPLIINKKYLWVLAIAYVLSLVHTSALIFIPLAMVAGQSFQLSKKEIYIWGGVIIALIVFSTSSLVNIIDPLFAGDQFESYKENYLKGDDHSSIINGAANAILMYFIISWAYRNRNVLTKVQNVVFRLSLLYLMCPFLGSLGRTRMTYYFIPFYIITITYLMKDEWPVKWQKQLFITIAVLMMLYSTFIVWMNNPYFKYHHYESIFSM